MAATQLFFSSRLEHSTRSLDTQSPPLLLLLPSFASPAISIVYWLHSTNPIPCWSPTWPKLISIFSNLWISNMFSCCSTVSRTRTWFTLSTATAIKYFYSETRYIFGPPPTWGCRRMWGAACPCLPPAGRCTGRGSAGTGWGSWSSASSAPAATPTSRV